MDNVLLIVNMQEFYVGRCRNKKLYNYDCDKLIDSINKRIAKYDPEEVFYIKTVGKGLFKGGMPKSNAAESDIVTKLKVVSKNVYQKSKPDAFSNDGRGQWQDEQRRQDNQSSQGIQNKDYNQNNQNNLNEQNLQKEDNNSKRRIVTEEIVKATNSNTDLIIISRKNNIDVSIKASNSEIISTHDKKQFSENDDAITIKNFHRDLFDIYMTKIPNDNYLKMFYIPTTIHCNFEVKCLDEDYISLFVQLAESRNTSSIKRLFYNIDLNKGKIINIKDILGENYKENAVKVINGEIDKWSDDQKATLIENYSVEKYIDENTPFFINNNHKAVVEIEKFAITIGAAGYHEFQIP